MGADTALTTNDAWVLNIVFNPENSLVQPRVLVNPNLPPIPDAPQADLTAIQATELAAIRPLDCPSPSRALVETAVAQLTDLINANPTYASAYNNRAQALSLLAGNDVPAFSSMMHALWSDVSSAIRLASPSFADAEVSQLQGKVLAAAYTQRGKLLWQVSQSIAAVKVMDADVQLGLCGASQAEGFQTEDLRGMDRHDLEELANRDFEMAGRYGNEDARKMGIITNPYSKLCGAIVREAMREEMGMALDT